MRAFAYERASDLPAALHAAHAAANASAAGEGPAFLAGGTTLVDLMKLDVMRPQTLVDINPLEATALGRIEATARGLKLGALVRMAEAADHAAIRRDYPVLAQALELAASPQIRHMASLGGNVLQRTRCSYFRDTSYLNCNKRQPGSGCAARDGINRQHAVLGVSEHCIATYPGDLAQALIALDAKVEIASSRGSRTIPFHELHRLPGDRPDRETTLQQGELIAAFTVPAGPWTRRSRFLKIRDRESYEFALASVAVALDLDGDTVRHARLALGGVATVPWRARAAEDALVGKRLDDATLRHAADAAFADAAAREHNEFKIRLGRRALMRAVREAASLEI